MSKLDKALHRVPHNPGRIGRVPLSGQTGSPAVNSSATMRLWSGHRMVYQMPFHPPSTMGLANCNDFRYYPIFRFPNLGSSGTVQLSGVIVHWTGRFDNESSPNILWYPEYTPTDEGDSVDLFNLAPGPSEAVDYGDKIILSTHTIKLISDNFLTQPTSGQFTTGMLVTDAILPAAVAIFRGAKKGSPSAADWRVEPADCAYGKPLRESDFLAEMPGLGKLLRLATTSDFSTDVLVNAVASPLFAWGHHHGIWIGQGETDSNIFGASGAVVKVCPRPIFQDATQPLTVAVVYSAGATSSMTITGSGSASGSATIALATAANPTVKEATYASNDLVCSTSTPGDLEFTVTTPDNSSANDWCIIHSISVYPFPAAPS